MIVTPRALPALALLLVLGACGLAPRADGPEIPAAATPRFDPMVFFTGRLEGKGQLNKLFSPATTVRVESIGHVEDGVLHLAQVVHEGEKPERRRAWTLREVGPGRYRGALDDATGPVTVETTGNRLHIAFTMKGGFPAEQWLTLSPDGRTAQNILTVRKFGLTVAVLAESIRKVE